jgi:hypothetical protein
MPGIAAFGRAICAAAVVICALGMGFPSLAAAQTPTPTPGGPCCLAHDGPGCDDIDCQECVCDVDSVCCIRAWDTFCAETSTIIRCPDECACDVTPGPTPTPGGDCCTARDPGEGGTGCDDIVCQTCVCGVDPLCCTNIWDTNCTLAAREECDSSCPCLPLPSPTPTAVPTPGGDCCQAHAGPSCNDSECRACVCEVDSACCTGVWDARCVEEASLDCALECPCPGTGDCCQPHAGVGCEDARCKNCVCEADDACCDDERGWDADCVSEAMVECAASCTCEAAGDCCVEHIDTLGCDNTLCQDCVCAIDPACCTEGWDARCAEEAAFDCNTRCGGCGVSNCCIEHATPGCEVDACETCVCNADEFCCESGARWDGTCVDIAGITCGSTCQCRGPTPNCAGDCNDNGMVTINELINCVGISLGTAQPSVCPACDQDGADGVEINELIAAVSASLTGCPM